MRRLLSRTIHSRGINTQSSRRISLVLQRRAFSQIQERQHDEDDGQDHNKFDDSTNIIYPMVGVAIGAMAIGGVLFKSYYQHKLEQEYQDGHTVMNYSGMHSATPIHYFQPKSVQEVENLVAYCHQHQIAFRPMGTGLSPNGIAYSDNAIMDMSHCNRIISIDKEKKQITVEAGIKLKDIITAISNTEYNMALENIPSIQEQQIGGLIQVGAHGTGIDICPCDMQITKMTLVTPKHGKMVLTPDDDLFYYARVGLGSIGVVTEVTLQCVERHKLCEYMWVMNVEELLSRRNELLHDYLHCKWLWIPYTDRVVVFASNKIDDAHYEALYHGLMNERDSVELEVECQAPLRRLLAEVDASEVSKHLSFADLRDLLLGYDGGKHVLDTEWIKRVNVAEMEYWTNVSQKYQTNARVLVDEQEKDVPVQIDYSENVLSFACGGQQCVYEICFPMKKYHDFDKDGQVPLEIQFSLDVLRKIEEHGVPAPAPLEHRFSRASSSYLSPAYSEQEEDAFTWFNIILYIPTQEEQKRRWIANEFEVYSRILNEVADKYGAVGHWAKVETYHLNKQDRKQLQKRLHRRFGHKLKEFFEICKEHDPNGILINDVVSDFFCI